MADHNDKRDHADFWTASNVQRLRTALATGVLIVEYDDGTVVDYGNHWDDDEFLSLAVLRREFARALRALALHEKAS